MTTPNLHAVDAEACFTDVDGRLIEIRVDDRDGRRRQRAPVCAVHVNPAHDGRLSATGTEQHLRWYAARSGNRVTLGLDVTELWRPERLPWLMRLVTTVMPVFRRWPTTYRWRAHVQLGPPVTMTSTWERTTPDAGRAYRRATRS